MKNGELGLVHPCSWFNILLQRVMFISLADFVLRSWYCCKSGLLAVVAWDFMVSFEFETGFGGLA